jgi:acetyl esterase/lipase
MVGVYGGYVYVILVYGGILPGTAEYISFLMNLHSIITFIYYGSMVILLFDFIFTRTNTPHILSQNQSRFNNALLLTIRIPLFLVFLLLLSGIIILGYVFYAGDPFMVITFFSVPMTLGIVIPVIIWFLQLVGKKKKSPKGMDKPIFWAIIKVGAIFSLVFLTPLISVPCYSNPPLDAQFATMFGSTWESQIPANIQAEMRPSRYSLFANIYQFNFSANCRFDIPYMKDFPTRVRNNVSTVIDTFYFDAYLPPEIPFGNLSDLSSPHLPVLIMMHGEIEEKGPWNANMTSQYFASLGYLVCDMNYGYLRSNEHGRNETGINATGYYLSDQIRQIGQFTQFLQTNADFFHADLSHTYFSGRHLGGGLSLICGLGYNTTLSKWFTPNMIVRGIIPYYPVSDIGTEVTSWANTVQYFGEPFLSGSADPSASDFNPEWIQLNPIHIIANNSTQFAPIFLITGTHDTLITMEYNDHFVDVAKNAGHSVLYGLYLHGNDGFDGNLYSPFGQSIIYYVER